MPSAADKLLITVTGLFLISGRALPRPHPRTAASLIPCHSGAERQAGITELCCTSGLLLRRPFLFVFNFFMEQFASLKFTALPVAGGFACVFHTSYVCVHMHISKRKFHVCVLWAARGGGGCPAGSVGIYT